MGKSKPRKPLGRQDLCAAVVLDSSLHLYVAMLHPISIKTAELLSQVAHFRMISLLRSSFFMIQL